MALMPKCTVDLLDVVPTRRDPGEQIGAAAVASDHIIVVLDCLHEVDIGRANIFVRSAQPTVR